MMRQQIHLLISQEGYKTYQDRIESALSGAGLDPCQIVPVHLEANPDRAGHYPIEVAFLTRDVTGKSTKGMVLPTLQRYYDMLRSSPGLQWIQGHSAGIDRPIFKELLARNVRVTTGSGANTSSVVQTALAGILALSRHFPEMAIAQKEHRWATMIGRDDLPLVSFQSAVIIGLGPVGLELARVLKYLGMSLVGVTFDPKKHPVDDVFSQIYSFDQFDAALAKTDYLILACPLTQETTGLIDQKRLSLLPKSAYLINVARGEVVDQQALVIALQKQELAGAFLDVFDPEPLPIDSVLWDIPSVIISPHTAGHFSGLGDEVAKIFSKNLVAYFQNQDLINEAYLK